MLKKLKFALCILMLATLTGAMLFGCSKDNVSLKEGGASNVCYIIKESDYAEFKERYTLREPEEEKKKDEEPYRVPYVETLTAGERYYIVGYTLSVTEDDSVVEFWDNTGFTLTANVPISETVDVVDTGYDICSGGSDVRINRDSEQETNEKTMFYNVVPTASSGQMEFVSYLVIEPKAEVTLDIRYQIVGSRYMHYNGPSFDRANTVSENRGTAYFAKKIDVSTITVEYIEGNDYVDGSYDALAVKDAVNMKVGKVYYMVLTANINSRIEESAGETFSLNVKLPLALLDGTLEVAGSGNFTEVKTDTEKNISVSFKIPEKSEGAKKITCIVKLIPVAIGEPDVTVGFSAYQISIFGDGKIDKECKMTVDGEEKTSEGFEYILSDDKSYYILENVGTASGSSSFLIPAEYESKPVKEIAENAFRDVKNMRTVEVSEGIEKIGQNAFSGCTNLLSAKLPCSAVVENSAFAGCSSINSLTVNLENKQLKSLFGSENTDIPSSLKTVEIIGSTTLAASAFAGGNMIESISLPASLTDVGDGSFTDCSSLISLTVDTQNQSFFVQCGILYGKTTVEALGWVGVFPAIMNYPEGVVTIPGGDMSGVNDITVPDSATGFIGSVTGLKPMGAKGPRFLFDEINVANLVVAKVTSGTEAPVFSGAEKLAEVVLPDTVTAIPYNAFNDCTALRTLKIPSGVISIGGSAFNGCAALSEITLPDGITAIAGLTFKDCKALKVLKIPSGVTEIGERAFEGCLSLASVTMPTVLNELSDYAFKGCIKLTSITLPTGEKYIQPHVFEGCTALATVVIPSGVEAICEGAFSGCTSLKTVVLPETLRIIDPAAFESSGLTSINIPAAVTTLSKNAFVGCTALKSITVDEGNALFYSVDGIVFYKADNSLWIKPAGKQQ